MGAEDLGGGRGGGGDDGELGAEAEGDERAMEGGEVGDGEEGVGADLEEVAE